MCELWIEKVQVRQQIEFGVNYMADTFNLNLCLLTNFKIQTVVGTSCDAVKLLELLYIDRHVHSPA